METTLKKVSISGLKEQLKEAYYLSDDLVITALDADNNIPREYSAMVDGFLAIIVVNGSGRLTIDTVEYEVTPNTVVLSAPNCAMRGVSCTDDFSAWFVACSKAFVGDIQVDLSTSLPVFLRIGKEPCLQVTAQDAQEIRLIFQLIKRIIDSDKEHYRVQIIRNLFTAAFYIITELNLRNRTGGSGQGRAGVIFEEFMQLLKEYDKQERNVGFYARKLNITPKYLSTVAKAVSGKTAAKWIDESVILEAKSLLRYSGMSIQEIAYHLHFPTQSFFGKYFKQHTGQSPSRFKRSGS